MMTEIDLLDHLPRTRRNLEERIQTVSDEDRRIAQKFDKEFFDGPRSQGYGGYRYDGRWKPVARRFQEHYGLDSTSRVLDVGCAKGFLLKDLQDLVPGIQIAGIDVSQYAIDNAMEDVKSCLKVADAKKLPYPDKSFDLIISINTIHNLEREELKQSLREMERVSCKDKFLVVDAYRNEDDRKRMLMWNLTAKTHMYVDEWVKLFKEVGYTGDFFWFIP